MLFRSGVCRTEHWRSKTGRWQSRTGRWQTAVLHHHHHHHLSPQQPLCLREMTRQPSAEHQWHYRDCPSPLAHLFAAFLPPTPGRSGRCGAPRKGARGPDRWLPLAWAPPVGFMRGLRAPMIFIPPLCRSGPWGSTLREVVARRAGQGAVDGRRSRVGVGVQHGKEEARVEALFRDASRQPDVHQPALARAPRRRRAGGRAASAGARGRPARAPGRRAVGRGACPNCPWDRGANPPA